MSEITFFIGAIGAVMIIDQIGLYLERNGKLYWRKKKGASRGTGNALMEIDAMLNPSARHALEYKVSPIKNQKKKETTDGLKRDEHRVQKLDL